MGQARKGLGMLRRVINETSQTDILGDAELVPDTAVLDAMHDLASLYDRVGEKGEALAWFTQTVEGYQRVLGRDHPTTRREVEMIRQLGG